MKDRQKDSDSDQFLYRIAALKPSPAPQPSSHPPLTERTSYVEEPPSATTTLERKEKKMEKERALVRRITNDMQVAHFVTKMDHTPLAQRGGRSKDFASVSLSFCVS